MIEQLHRLLEPIRNRVRLLVGRGVISSAVSKSAGVTLQADLLDGEVRDNIELVQHYGISSRPLDGSQVVVLFMGGSRDSGVAIATKGLIPEALIDLQPGEVAIHTAEGDFVHLKKGRVVAIHTETLEITATKSVKITSPTVETTGTLADANGTVDELRAVYNQHTHLSAAVGSPTAPPVPLAS